LVHDGDAESGHYYTFIFDRASNKWWRLNDFQASEETEETVMLESFGGQSHKGSKKTAYSLFYINDHMVKNSYQSPMFKWRNLQKLPGGVELTPELYQHINASNNKHSVDKTEFNSRNVVQKISNRHRQ
jgi:hypothetical protein